MKHNLLVSQQLSEFLLKYKTPATFFSHDVTFGHGQAALLSSNQDLVNHYNTLRIPLIFTNQRGRTLQDGIYLSQYLMESAATEFAEQYYPALRSQFSFKYCLSISENETDSQHLYTFYFNTDELQFFQHIINNVHWYKQFITQYKMQLSDLILRACDACLEYPYMDIPAPDSSQLLNLADSLIDSASEIKSLSIQQAKCFQLLRQGLSSKEIAFTMQLSPRTIEHYIATIKRKLHCKNIKELLLRY
ncbi:MAG TPA: LuxR C-terminal-related transcriptional regulator [Gammaproteobacteria bacterium]|jgi:DNA-binding CsgD family transcriptional regulator|nr:LuxR C-terminal-related transcriptional regulator [Gammaproteobacteria bacterium]